MKLAFEMEMGGLFSTMKTAGVTLVQCNRFSHMYRFEAIRFIGFKFISYSPTDICKLPDLTKWAHLTLVQNWNAGLISKIQKTSILATKINKSFSIKYNSHEFPEKMIFISFQQTSTSGVASCEPEIAALLIFFKSWKLQKQWFISASRYFAGRWSKNIDNKFIVIGGRSLKWSVLEVNGRAKVDDL